MDRLDLEGNQVDRIIRNERIDFKMRILSGQISHETNTFCNIKATKDHFKQLEWDEGDEIIDRHLGVRSFLCGMIDRSEELQVDLITTFSANGHPSGRITADAYQKRKHILLTAINEYKDVDAICMAMHGAGIAEGEDDIEGAMLQEMRSLVGYDLPIVITLDL